MLKIKNFSYRKILIACLYVPALIATVVFLGINLYFHFQGKGGYTIEPGLQFADFKPILKNEHKINYLTDKDMTPEKNDGQFLMAQYMLAPTVIELNTTQNRFSIIDSNNPVFILNTLKLNNSVPVVVNQYGKVLAVKK